MSNEAAVRSVIESWARAVSNGDRRAILKHHADDLSMFDFPNEVSGLEAYDRTWDFFFANPRGPITFRAKEMHVEAGEDVAFASCLMRCEGTSAGVIDFRLTTGLRKVDGEWVIVHEHHSVPTVEERFIGPGAGDAAASRQADEAASGDGPGRARGGQKPSGNGRRTPGERRPAARQRNERALHDDD
jgi:ketosteroid isomerase-like protein